MISKREQNEIPTWFFDRQWGKSMMSLASDQQRWRECGDEDGMSFVSTVGRQKAFFWIGGHSAGF
jgi:hypothetical protein